MPFQKQNLIWKYQITEMKLLNVVTWMNQAGDIIAIFQVRMHPGVTVENSKSQKDELIVQGKGTFRYYVNAQTGKLLEFRGATESLFPYFPGQDNFCP